jgi:transcriptional regulator with AAA-type ATPase domain
VDALGGWPLDRKWYALAIQNLTEGGAGRIFIDIAFPAADFAHPESDEFLYATLAKNPQVYLLNSTLNATNGDSLAILGKRLLSANRFFLPFSAAFAIEDNRIWLKANVQQSLLRWLLPADFTLQNILFPFPETGKTLDFQFLEAVQGPIACAGKDIFIFLDYPGVTSYIVNENSRNLISTSDLQLYAAQQIRAGNYAVKWPDWTLGGLFLFALLPLVFHQKIWPQAAWSALSLCLVVGLLLGLYFGGIYLAKIWYGFTLIPVGVLCYEAINSRFTRKLEKWQAALPRPQENVLPVAPSYEVKQLREKLGFYEYLMNQTPPAVLDNPGHPNILYHPESPLVRILQKAAQVARADIPVMIFGESGTGKEQLAKYIHENSSRAAQPFIAVNCASLNENLIESELFGYEAGAFTGALKRKIGRFELADGGTLFLDEIGETASAFQAKLLRVLQEGSFERVGGVETVHVAVRLIAATNQNLQEKIQAGRFREDLFYRLNGFSLQLPPLRERNQDIEYLFRTFLLEADPGIQLSAAIISWLSLQKWPGNIRELKAATKRAVINAQLKRRKFLLPEDFELQNVVEAGVPDEKENMAQRILQALRADGLRHRSISFAAKQVGIHRATATEYWRGWVIRYLNTCGFDMPQLCRALAGDAVLDNQAQFESRVAQYAASIRRRIEEGLRQNEPESALRYSRFKNLPGEFEPELLLLIAKIRNESRR